MDQSNFDLAFPEVALNSPIVVLFDDTWTERRNEIRQLLGRSTDTVTELALWNWGPMHGKGIMRFLNESVIMPLANVVSVNFSAQCLSTLDYLTHFGSHRLPGLRRLRLSLYHLPGLLLKADIDTDVGCFPSLNEAHISFVGYWCLSSLRAVLKPLRSATQLTLLGTNLSILESSCCTAETHFSFENLRKLRTSISFFYYEKMQEIKFPNLELVVLSYPEVRGYLKVTWRFNAYFPGAKIHFGIVNGFGVSDPNDCGAYNLQNSAAVTLAFEDPLEISCPPGVRFMGCSEMCLIDDRILPLSLKDVYVRFSLKPIVTRLGVYLEKSDIEEIILKSDVGISHLICKVALREKPLMKTAVQDCATLVRLKFLPLLTIQKNTLTSLNISTHLLIGCLKDQQTLRQIVNLRGQLSKVSALVVNTGFTLCDTLSNAVRVRAADLRPFLEMFPSLSFLDIENNYWLTVVNVDDFCGVCPSLKTLIYHSDLLGCGGRMIKTNPPWRLDTLHWHLENKFTFTRLFTLPDCVQASYILLVVPVNQHTLMREDVEDIFSRMPCLCWLVLVSQLERRTWICSRFPNDKRVEISSANTVSFDKLLSMYPPVFSKFWVYLLARDPIVD
ncbi:unnamed protein product [Schistocephalus solidus]|uniref:Protein kinase domain-containing protein n=1 Tax=Schistocephalus solidus TaxID=70667 RepID=A0A183S8B6_SCHSO|nr:unnamed protein product [Schistocephalus solidus]